MHAAAIFALSVSLAVALTLQILACALYHNWWPLLTGAVYVMVPMPFLFLGGGEGGDSYVSLGGAGDGDGWADVAKFATGATAIWTVGIPVVLAHAELIQPVQLAWALPSALLLAATAVAYVVLSRRADGYAYGF